MTVPSLLSVALVQFPVEGGHSVDSFLRKAAHWLDQCRGANLIVFPELFSGDLLAPFSADAAQVSIFEERRQWARFLERDSSPLQEGLLRLAREQVPESWVVWGSIPRQTAAGVLNTAWISGPGEKTLFQDKLYLTPCEARVWSWQDGVELRPWRAPWGETVLLICHDVEVPSLSQKLVALAPELLIVPSCTGSVRGLSRVRWCGRARAIEHHAYVVQTSTVGPGAGTPNMNEHTGQAAILAPSEEGFESCTLEGPLDQATVLRGTLDFELLRRSRKKHVVYPARDERARAADLGVRVCTWES